MNIRLDSAHLTSRALREEMIRTQIQGRGIHTASVLDAMRTVPRERFLAKNLKEFAYEDTSLPIDQGQTISEPYIVALMIEASGIGSGDKVLEIGTGSGYAAALLAEIAQDVYTVEHHSSLAQRAAKTLSELGYRNIHIRHGEGSEGWFAYAPYDAIIVTASVPYIPPALKDQLKIGGRLIAAVGTDTHAQELVRVTRVSEDEFKTEDIADIRLTPFIGAEAWPLIEAERPILRTAARAERDLLHRVIEEAQPFDDIETADLRPLLERIGDARVVLLGEATHGTSEFYRMRDRITRALIMHKGFDFVAAEADWPDAARVDHYVRQARHKHSEWTAFARFPTWMWRNREFHGFVEWLHSYNAELPPDRRVAFHGLDLYSLHTSIDVVLNYLETIDPETARVARERYGCLTPWQSEPSAYGHAALTGAYRSCEKEVVQMLADLVRKQSEYATHDGERFLDAAQNARLIANAERYYRIMYYGSRASWNLRDDHMFDTLETLLAYRGSKSKAVVWAHNSHIGDASATEMSARGEHNIGQLCRKRFGDAVYSIGFGTNSGTVAAASDWDGPMEIKSVRPAMPKSYERLCHETKLPRFMLPLRSATVELRHGLSVPRLERAIGVIYRPQTEYESHYFDAELPKQFDEYIWFDQSGAIVPLTTEETAGMPDTYPFGL